MKLRRSGFTLLEMTAAMAGMGVALGLGVVLLATALRANAVGAGTLQHLAWRTELANQFRDDVGRATATPERLGEFAAGPACLILETASGTVVYRFADGRLERIVGDRRRDLPFGGDDASVGFERLAGDPPRLVLRLTDGVATRPVRTDVAAVLGGDRR